MKVPLGTGFQRRRRRAVQSGESGAEAAFGVLGAEECFYLAGGEVRLKAVIKTGIWQENILFVGGGGTTRVSWRN